MKLTSRPSAALLYLLLAAGNLSGQSAPGGLEGLLGARAVGDWTEVTVDSTRNVGTYLDVALDPTTGAPYVSYYDGVNGDLWLARYVGSGGNCGPASAWTCQLVDAAGDVGRHCSIAVDDLGDGTAVVIAYHDQTNGSMRFASGPCGPTAAGSHSGRWQRAACPCCGSAGDERLEQDHVAALSQPSARLASSLLLARSLAQAGEGGRAIALLTEAAEREPEMGDLWLRLGEQLLIAGRRVEGAVR